MQINRNLRIAIECRIPNFKEGVGSAILALAKSLSDTRIDGQEYTFIVHEGMRDWLTPYVYGPCKLASIAPSRFSALISVFKRALRPIAPLRHLMRKYRTKALPVPVSDGYVESHNFDLVHFPTQSAYLTELPSIYQPWDLQHLHYPQFFSRAEFDQRERYYRVFCDRASFVCVQTQWTKSDVIENYGIAEEKVEVIPWGSVFDAYKAPSTETVQATAKKYELPDRFFFYPAATWQHKNHKVILRALHLMKAKDGDAPHVFFTGMPTDYRPILNKLAEELGVSKHVHFLGFLASQEVHAVFAMATAMIFASKFEGFGLPILEAFHAGLPVISSNATTLPEVARDAALYFDPDAPDELAELMSTILDDPELRLELIKKGAEVLSQYSMNDTAANFQTLYARTDALTSQRDRPPSVSATI